MTSYTTPSTQSTGYLVGTTEYNNHIINNIKHLYEGLNGVVILQDQQTTSTDGGTFTSGAWQTRTLNTEVVDVNGVCTLSSNQFTLDAGTYEILASAPAYYVINHQARLQNISDTATELTGTSEYSYNANTAQTRSVIQGRFTIASSKTFEIQHRCNTTRATNGFGAGAGFTTEVFTTVFLRKVA